MPSSCGVPPERRGSESDDQQKGKHSSSHTGQYGHWFVVEVTAQVVAESCFHNFVLALN